jgi:putative membrane protein
MHDYFDGGGWTTADWVAMSAMMVIFWAALIGLVVWIAHSVRRPEVEVPPTDHPARETLDERLARGEIDPDDYVQRRELLRSLPRR